MEVNDKFHAPAVFPLATNSRYAHDKKRSGLVDPVANRIQILPSSILSVVTVSTEPSWLP